MVGEALLRERDHRRDAVVPGAGHERVDVGAVSLQVPPTSSRRRPASVSFQARFSGSRVFRSLVMRPSCPAAVRASITCGQVTSRTRASNVVRWQRRPQAPGWAAPARLAQAPAPERSTSRSRPAVGAASELRRDRALAAERRHGPAAGRPARRAAAQPHSAAARPGPHAGLRGARPGGPELAPVRRAVDLILAGQTPTRGRDRPRLGSCSAPTRRWRCSPTAWRPSCSSRRSTSCA